LQLGTQAMPSQVALPLAGAVHGMHVLPHDIRLVLPLTTHAPLHSW
jgi:hypothetical protein